MHPWPPRHAPDLGPPPSPQACRTVFVVVHAWGRGHVWDREGRRRYACRVGWLRHVLDKP